MTVICISGLAQSGKDTYAGFLRRHLENRNRNVLIIHYADQLKYICGQYFGWDGVKDESGRSILQFVGTDMARAKDPHIWVKYVAQFLRIFGSLYDFVIIPDCRFPNEIDWLNGEYDSVSVNVLRPYHNNGLTEEQRFHPSETSMKNYDFTHTVVNDAGLRELDAKAKEMADDMIRHVKIMQILKVCEVPQ